MPQLDVATYPAQLFWLLVSFSAFFCTARWIIVPRLAATLKNREEKLSTLLAEARKMQQEAQQKEQQAEAALHAAQQEVRDIFSQELAQLKEHLKTREGELQFLYTKKHTEAVQALQKAAESVLSKAQKDVITLSEAAVEEMSKGDTKTGRKRISLFTEEKVLPPSKSKVAKVVKKVPLRTRSVPSPLKKEEC
ncbi:MAG: hypothetical protein LBH38_00590 [Holosporales bacterium]|jgi:F-type H+-transporting ATPase subunit b|nr:hypothetical protein [Holosporales bacterium]